MKQLFDDIIIPTQKKLYSKIQQMFNCLAVCGKDSYILVPGESPIMLVAHMDTIHKESVRQICRSDNGTILMSPQGIGGDDRCGVYALLKIYHESDIKPWLLFTCDEEIGGIGAKVFCRDYYAGLLPEGLIGLKLLIEIDRQGKNDAVYYDCENAEFKKYIGSKGFKTKWGSFSDISVIAPTIGTAAVNLSSGYYNAHTLHEYINTDHLNYTINIVKEIVREAASKDFFKYEYVSGCDFKKIFSDIPDEFIDEYIDLLDLYTLGELNEIYRENGGEMIHELWEWEFWGDDRRPAMYGT